MKQEAADSLSQASLVLAGAWTLYWNGKTAQAAVEIVTAIKAIEMARNLDPKLYVAVARARET